MNPFWTGALLGAGIAGALGGLLLAIYGGCCICDEGRNYHPVKGTLLLILACLLFCAGLGAVNFADESREKCGVLYVR